MIPVAALSAALLLLFLPVVAGGESFFGRDVTPFFYPMKQYLAEAVRSGRLPLWSPFVAGGEPFFASLQPGALYPGSLVLYVLPFPHAFDWLIVLHFWFGATGWVLWMRHEGRSPPAAAFGAVAFVLGGYFVSLGNFVNNLQTMSWTPWLFLAWALYLRDRRPGRFLAFVGACAAAFLGGEPQLLGLVLVLVFARGMIGRRPSGLGPVGHAASFAAAGSLALLLVGLQLVPFLEYVSESVRTSPLELSYAASRSQEPIGLVHLLVPPALAAGELGFTTRHLASSGVPWLLSLYAGVMVLAFAGLGFMGARRAERWFWSVVVMLGLLLALGGHTPVYRGAFEALPPLRVFRYPEKFAVPLAIGLPLFAAAGFDRWRTGEACAARFAWCVVALASAYGLVALWLGVLPGSLAALCADGAARPLLCEDPSAGARAYAATAGRQAAILVATAGVLVLHRRGRLRGAPAAWTLVGLAVLDLGGAHRAVNPSVESEVYTTPPWAAGVLAPLLDRGDEYRFRATPVQAPMGQTVRVRGAADLSNLYLDFQAMGPNLGQLFGFLQQDGLQGVELTSVAMTHDAAIRGWSDDPVRFLRTMNVRFYGDATVGADSMAGLQEVGRHPELPIRLYEVPDPLPRAYIADGWETAGSPGPALHRALQGDVPLRRVVLEGEAPRAASAAGGSVGRVVAATWEAERIRLITRTAVPGVLVLLDRWYPGWKVSVNGVPATPLRANGVFRAVEVPAGRADVEFFYAPTSLAIGAASTVLGLAVCLAIWWWPRRRSGAA